MKKNTNGDLWLEHGDWTQEKILKELIIERIENIGLLGGFKSKGCGAVEIKVNEIEVKES